MCGGSECHVAWDVTQEPPQARDHPIRRSGAGQNPGVGTWMPACAGMTTRGAARPFSYRCHVRGAQNAMLRGMLRKSLRTRGTTQSVVPAQAGTQGRGAAHPDGVVHQFSLPSIGRGPGPAPGFRLGGRNDGLETAVFIPLLGLHKALGNSELQARDHPTRRSGAGRNPGAGSGPSRQCGSPALPSIHPKTAPYASEDGPLHIRRHPKAAPVDTKGNRGY